jgi:hypothetical protein
LFEIKRQLLAEIRADPIEGTIVTVAVPFPLQASQCNEEIEFLLNERLDKEELDYHYSHSLFIPKKVNALSGVTKNIHAAAKIGWADGPFPDYLSPKDDDWRKMSNGSPMPLWAIIRYMRGVDIIKSNFRAFPLVANNNQFRKIIQDHAAPQRASVRVATTYLYPDSLRELREAAGLSIQESSREFELSCWEEMEAVLDASKKRTIFLLPASNARELVEKLRDKVGAQANAAKGRSDVQIMTRSPLAKPNGKGVSYRVAT